MNITLANIYAPNNDDPVFVERLQDFNGDEIIIGGDFNLVHDINKDKEGGTFFLVSQTILNKTTTTDILPGYKTDHSLILITISLHSDPRGLGIWKLNTSFLYKIDYVNQINAQIKEVQEEYQSENSINPALMWEMIKLTIREKSMAYAVRKKRSVSRKVDETEQIIAQLEKEIENHLTSEEEEKDLQSRIECQKRELEKITE